MNYFKLQRSLTTHLYVGRYFKAGGTKKSGLYTTVINCWFHRSPQSSCTGSATFFLQNINTYETSLGDITKYNLQDDL